MARGKVDKRQLSLDFLFGGVPVLSGDREEPEKVPEPPPEPQTSPQAPDPEPAPELPPEPPPEPESKEEEPPEQTEAQRIEGHAYLEMLCQSGEHLIFLWGRNPHICNVRSHSYNELKTNAWVMRERALEILEEYGYRRKATQYKGDHKAAVFSPQK